MIALTENEKRIWSELGEQVLAGHLRPDDDPGGGIRPNLAPMFHFYAGARLAARHRELEARAWFARGAHEEDELLFTNAFFAAFLDRQNDRFVMPDVAFADPRPFVHFTTVPLIRSSRARFVKHCGHSLPVLDKPLRIMDLGCGNGALVADLLTHLVETGRIVEVDEILLVDSSQAMLDLARETVGKSFPPSRIRTLHARIEDAAAQIEGHYDIALSSLAYHHMPLEEKRRHLLTLRPHFDHFILFELNADNDRPELDTPELAVSVYQSYGRIIDAVFAHDAPVEVAQSCVDRFLLTEAVSMLTQPRGQRTEYHMLRLQWHDLFRDALGDDFACIADTTAYADEYLDLFTLHYARAG